MLFRKEFLEGIRTGAVTLAFRRWRRPSVRSGGTLLTPVGQLHIVSVEPVALNRISAADARRAGYESREKLLDELQRRPDGEIYRIELGSLLPDPRIALRETSEVAEAEYEALRHRLRRLDARASEGAWTLRTLEALSSHPGVRAGELCGLVGLEKERFKLNVRKLKNLGLTESLGTGYRLSPRGEALLSLLRSDTGNAP
ncbi:hypothetical protein E4656_01135 [Natronospirillum operosum]|uniref:ASCH domain-containing protein n=1 Tax=Natronospirillum operosum TaxID=2759953 RepID=A0A4Z0WI51_9GAMM|nr:hypothetical protein [Natronospirillum operosum]TGG95063.1 hypothetical protein E4656_01135 [Natronospirillum operosum]